MSRSRRKPYITDQNAGKPDHGKRKRVASKAVRATGPDDVAGGAAYRRVYDSWNIRDWSFHAPKDPKARRK